MNTENVKDLFKTEGIICKLIPVLQWLISFITDRFLFIEPVSHHILVYTVCKVILLILLFMFWNFIFRSVISADRKRNDEYKIFLYALPYLLFLAILFLIYSPIHFKGDQLNIFNSALSLDPYFFTYLTGGYYILSLMILPIEQAPIIIKLILVSLIAGYCVKRCVECYHTKLGYLLYAIFIFPPVVEMGLSVHRMPLYGMVYLFFCAKLLFDYAGQGKLGRWNWLIMVILAAVLTVWRREGIYLYIIGGGGYLCSIWKEKFDTQAYHLFYNCADHIRNADTHT